MSQAKLKVVENNTMDKENRSKSLEAAVSLIEKNYGKGSIMKLGSKTNVDIESISTGSLGLDIALGIGGVPKGRIVEIYGPESSGKTTLATHIVAESQKKGGNCAFIDAEHALDPAYAKKLGVNLEELLISQPDTGEQGLEIADSLIKSGGIDLVFVDGMHTFKQSLEDILNSLEVLKYNGIIIVHDCYPPNKNAASPREIYPTKAIKLSEGWKGAWCGDVWKSIHYLSKTLSDNLNISVLDTDYGLGIITLKKGLKITHEIDEPLFNNILELDYSDLKKNPESMIHLQDSKQFKLEHISSSLNL